MSTELSQPTEQQQLTRSQWSTHIDNYWLTHATEATEKQTLFLQGLAEFGTVLHAAEFAQINRNTAYQWRKLFPEFKAAWDTALEDPVDRVEKTLYTMAVSGNNVTATMSYLRHNRAKYRDETRIIVSKEDVDQAIEHAIAEHQLPTLAIESGEQDHANGPVDQHE